MKITLPWPPSVNTYYRHVMLHGRPTTMISAKGREYRKAVATIVAQMFPRPKRTSAALRVHIKARPPDRRKRDLDNIAKSLLDSLQHAGVYEDDSQIDELCLWRGPVAQTGFGGVDVDIEEIA